MKRFFLVVMMLGVGVNLFGHECYGFGDARRPVMNPSFFDLPLVTNNVHGFIMYESLSDRISTTAGDLPLKGDMEIYSLQFEYAFTEHFSLIATKDGYIDFNPEETFERKDGFADLAAGVKFNFYMDEAAQMAAAFSITFEMPSGSDRVFQGNGNGMIAPVFTGMKLWNGWQFLGAFGFHVPMNSGKESTLFFHSWHVSYEVLKNFYPMVELSHYYVMNAGDGGRRFVSHANGVVADIANFEGGDMVNLGAANAGRGANLITMSFGGRYRLMDCVDLGGAFEMPLTNSNKTLMDYRLTLDAVYRF